jgi:HSP20 family protein
MFNYSFITDIIKKTIEPIHSLERSFSNFWRKTPTITYVEEDALLPEINITQNDDEFHITTHISGLNEDDIEIEIDNGVLTLKGEKKEEKEDNSFNVSIKESSIVNFRHRIQLPKEIDQNNVKATMKDGAIDIILAKLTKEQMRNQKDSLHIVKDEISSHQPPNTKV